MSHKLHIYFWKEAYTDISQSNINAKQQPDYFFFMIHSRYRTVHNAYIVQLGILIVKGIFATEHWMDTQQALLNSSLGSQDYTCSECPHKQSHTKYRTHTSSERSNKNGNQKQWS